MKQLLFKLSTVVTALAFFVTSSNVNTTCAFQIHQPELPAGAEKLKKHV